MILSIDVGIKNLAYVLFDPINTKIVEWKVLELCEKETKANKVCLLNVAYAIRNRLDENLGVHVQNIRHVVIENQLGPNAIRMKTIQGMLSMYFVIAGCTSIVYWSAANKLKPFVQTKKTTYAERKKLGVQVTHLYLAQRDAVWSDMFNKHKKKDDLSDCLLQMLDYAMKEKLLEPTFMDPLVEAYAVSTA
jgi:hypothetical protein